MHSKPSQFPIHQGRWLDVMRIKDGAVVKVYDWQPRPFERPEMELLLDEAEIAALVARLQPPKAGSDD
jgi:hypothetical protein